MSIQTQEARIIMAMEAIQTSKKMSCRAAAKLYNVPETTLRARMTGRPSRLDTRPKIQKLTELEEEVIVRFILDWIQEGLHPG
jgi:hypothetical protein